MTSSPLEQPVSDSLTVVAVKDQVSAELAGEAVILNLKSGIYYGLDAVGARIWELVQEPRTVADLRNVLLAEYDVEADRCDNDLLTLLQQMTEHGLVEVGNETDV